VETQPTVNRFVPNWSNWRREVKEHARKEKSTRDKSRGQETRQESR